MNVNDFEINFGERTSFGTSKASKLRKEGKIPATCCGKIKGKNVVLHGVVNAHELERLLASKTLFNKFTKINFGKEQYFGFASVLNRNSVNEANENIEFTLVDFESKDTIEMTIPIVFEDLDLCEEIKLGGVLNKVLTTLRLVAAPKNMPSYIRYSLENATAKKSIKVSDLSLAQGVSVSSRNKASTVATILAGKRKGAAASADNATA